MARGRGHPKAAVDLKYSSLVTYLVALLGLSAELSDGGQVLANQFLIRLEDQQRGREPAIIYVAHKNEGRLLDHYLDGPADLAIEVMSRGSEAADRGAKFEEYERGAAREFWLLDPNREEALFYIRDADGSFRPAIVRDGEFQPSVLPTIKLRVEWLWNQPPVMEVLREWIWFNLLRDSELRF